MHISVLVATYQRPRKLERCLDHLAAQERAPAFEVVVAIDGEEPETEALLRRRAPSWPFPLTVLAAPHAGQPQAINRAVRAAQGDLLITLGDDVYAAPQLVERHAERHRELNDPAVAVVGRTEWHPRHHANRFLRWERRHGALFAYPRMQPYAYHPPRFLLGCNYSVRAALMRDAGGMNERYPVWTDTLLAHRLSKLGMRVWYDPDALGFHDDDWTADQECARRRRKGRIAAAYLREEPGFAEFVSMPVRTPWRAFRYGVSRLVRPVAERLGWLPVCGWCWMHAIHWNFVEGYREGLADPESAGA